LFELAEEVKVSKASLKKAIGRENWQPILRKWTKTS
jgi:hypothetical protein